MSKKILKLFSLLSILILVSSCSVTDTVNTESTKALTQDLKEMSKSIKEVKFTFTRPELRIKINMKEEPSEETLDLILSDVKTFATVENVNEIAHSVGWELEVSDIQLVINGGKDKDSFEHVYFARYFKTFNASDYSKENIDAYQTWFKKEH